MVRDTVDGSEILRSPLEGKVVYHNPIIYNDFTTIPTVVGLGISEAPTVGPLSQHCVDAESQVTGAASQESIAACTTDLVGGQQNLGGGFKYFLFSTLPGEDSHFD